MTQLGRVPQSPAGWLPPPVSGNGRTKNLSTEQGPLDKHCPGGDGSSQEMGEHSEEYSFNDWGQLATGDRDKGESDFR